jgi:hypothetical protein
MSCSLLFEIARLAHLSLRGLKISSFIGIAFILFGKGGKRGFLVRWKFLRNRLFPLAISSSVRSAGKRRNSYKMIFFLSLKKPRSKYFYFPP